MQFILCAIIAISNLVILVILVLLCPQWGCKV